MSAKDIFDLSLTIKMHEQMIVPVHNKQQQESLRVSLSYNRRIFLENTNTDFDIIVSKITKGGKPFVCLTKLPRITKGIVVSPDGSTREMSFEDPDMQAEEVIVGTMDDFDEDARIRKAMKDDGYTDTEIEEYFSKTSKNDTLLKEESDDTTPTV
jgi:hypothetical protein